MDYVNIVALALISPGTFPTKPSTALSIDISIWRWLWILVFAGLFITGIVCLIIRIAKHQRGIQIEGKFHKDIVLFLFSLIIGILLLFLWSDSLGISIAICIPASICSIASSNYYRKQGVKKGQEGKPRKDDYILAGTFFAVLVFLILFVVSVFPVFLEDLLEEIWSQISFSSTFGYVLY
jgi:DMSO/TMAO reductase YedYZ heme-binding membrane subunit